MRVSDVTMVMSMASQCAQRSTVPAPRKTCTAPTASTEPQPSHVPIAVVISAPNTSRKSAAAALPSSISSSISSSRRAEPLGLDSCRLVAELDERACNGLDERRRPTDEDLRVLGCDFREHLPLDPPRAARPPVRLRARQRVDDEKAVRVQPLELVAIDDIVPRTRRKEQHGGDIPARCRP